MRMEDNYNQMHEAIVLPVRKEESYVHQRKEQNMFNLPKDTTFATMSTTTAATQVLSSQHSPPQSSMLDPLRLHAAQLSTHPFLGPAKEVSHGHPSLRVCVANFNANFGTRSDDLIGNVAVCNNYSLEGRLCTNASGNKGANGKSSKVLMA